MGRSAVLNGVTVAQRGWLVPLVRGAIDMRRKADGFFVVVLNLRYTRCPEGRDYAGPH
jgi:hypothetical protein